MLTIQVNTRFEIFIKVFLSFSTTSRILLCPENAAELTKAMLCVYPSTA